MNDLARKLEWSREKYMNIYMGYRESPKPSHTNTKALAKSARRKASLPRTPSRTPSLHRIRIIAERLT